jgi:hypothetical protein
MGEAVINLKVFAGISVKASSAAKNIHTRSVL